MDLTRILSVFLIIFIGLLGISGQTLGEGNLSRILRYTPAILKSLRPSANHDMAKAIPRDIPKIRKRGRRGGVRTRFRRRPFRPPLPSIIFGNVRSINNKVDELRANARFMNEYREAGFICVTETWLADQPNTFVNIEGFTVKRGDRSKDIDKDGGGGVCLFVNDKWCHDHNVHVTHQRCTPNAEILGVSMRPRYLPREFPKITMNVVYVPPRANNTLAIEEITEVVNEQQTNSPDSVIFVCGDFNWRPLNLPGFEQYVECHTRNDTIIDLFYGNVPSAFTSKQLPPLGSSDHRMILLTPQYKCVLKTEKIEKRRVTVWNDNNIDALKGCMDCTDWSVFKDNCKDVDELNEHVCSYIKFCEENIREEKEIKVFPNSKPWINKELKQCLTEKKKAFLTNDVEYQKTCTKNVKDKIRMCKDSYRQKLEESFNRNNARETWKKLKTMTGCKNSSPNIIVNSDQIDQYADELNNFYNRFDCHNFENERQKKLDDILSNIEECEKFSVDENDVRQAFERVNVSKACGPDGMNGFVLKHCANQLKTIFSYMFNLSLKCHQLPKAWKMSEIVPIPKKPKITELNDLRPVALTSVLVKCLEKIIVKEIQKGLRHCQDNMQFAYREKRSVEDAVLTLLNNIYSHLDTPRNYCRVLFVDFSSAFNTIQPHLIVDKLDKMNINKYVIAWILDFLTDRRQYVKAKNVAVKTGQKIEDERKTLVSQIITTNTGAPQGAVLSPFLFTAYTNDCQSDNQALIKFADDTVIQGLIKKEETGYRSNIDDFVKWCKDHSLLLNVGKTKELIIDFRINKAPIIPISIDGQTVEIVDHYKYLGIVIDKDLSWKIHAESLLKKIGSRMFFLRKLNEFRVSCKILEMFYRAFIESVICFGLVCWGGNVLGSQERKLNQVIKRAHRITWKKQKQKAACIIDFESLFICKCQSKVLYILKDDSHPLFPLIKFSTRSGRPILINCKTERHRNSFLPTAMKLM